MTENQFNGSFQNESEYEVNQYLSSLGILYRTVGQSRSMGTWGTSRKCVA